VFSSSATNRVIGAPPKSREGFHSHCVLIAETLGATGFGIWITESAATQDHSLHLCISENLQRPSSASEKEWHDFLAKGLSRASVKQLAFIARWRSEHPCYLFIPFSGGIAVFAGPESIWDRFLPRQQRISSGLRVLIKQGDEVHGRSHHFASELLKTRTLEAAARVCTNYFCEYLKANRVSLFFLSGRTWKLISCSGSLIIDAKSPGSRDLVSHFLKSIEGSQNTEIQGDLLSRWSSELRSDCFGVFIEHDRPDHGDHDLSIAVNLAVHALVGRLSLFQKLLISLHGPKKSGRHYLLKPCIVALSFLFLLWMLFRPVPQVISGPCELVPSSRADAVAETSGRILDVLVSEGEIVKQGQPLFQIDDRELVSSLKITSQRLLKNEAETRYWQESGDMKSFRTADFDRHISELEAKDLDKQIALSTVRSPINGVVLSKDLSLKRGAFIPTGTVLCEIASLSSWDLQIRADESDAGILEKSFKSRLSLPVRYVLQAQSGTTLHAKLSSRSEISQMAYPEARKSVLYVTIRGIELPPDLLKNIRPGFSGYAKIEGSSTPFLIGTLEKLLQFLRLRIFL